MSLNDQSDGEGIFLSWTHSDSRRTAIVEELDGMVWLYLTGSENHRPERDCPVFSTIPIIEKLDWGAVRESGTPPHLYREVATADAMLPNPLASEFSVVWSIDGQSVALHYSGRRIAMIVSGFELGHSAALLTKGPLGLPFDAELSDITFPPLKTD